MTTALQESLRLLNPELGRLYQEGHYQQALQRAGEVILPDEGIGADPDGAVFLHLVGNLHRELAEYAAAEKHYLQALPVLAAAGKDRPAYARALDDLARLYTLMGGFDQAEPLFRSALEVFASRSAVDEAGHACCLQHLADLLERRDARREGLRVLEKGQALLERVVGVNHPDFARGLLI